MRKNMPVPKRIVKDLKFKLGSGNVFADLMGLPQPKVSGLFRGDFANVSERKLMDCLNRLGYDIEIKVKPTAIGTKPP